MKTSSKNRTWQADQAAVNNSVLRSPIAIAIKDAFRGPSISRFAMSSLLCGSMGLAQAQSEPTVNKTKQTEDTIQVITVTSRKVAENLQQVPGGVAAFDEKKLVELHIKSFDDYALLFPSVSFTGETPGQSIVYMRGASDGGDGNSSGQHPGVAVYIDEQPVTAAGRNLDLNIYDVQRVEALAGPQSTLFGASSQSGTLRIITNKPSAQAFDAGVDVGVKTTRFGAMSHSTEGYVNIPLGKATAIRLVGYDVKDGGYIDNVPGTRTYNRPAPLTAVTQSNAALVGKDINTDNKSGGRIGFLTKITDDFSLSLNHINQVQKTRGVWTHDPKNPNGQVHDLQTQQFFPTSANDDYNQSSLMLEANLGFADLLYTTAYSDRKVNSLYDYSDYAEAATWVPAYSCEYPAYGTHATVDCTSTAMFRRVADRYKRTTHEVRLQSKAGTPLQYIVGLYAEKATHDYFQEWVQPGGAKGPDFSHYAPRTDLFYVTDQSRRDEQKALFGEVRYDLTSTLTGTVGGRYFKNSGSLKGVTGYGNESLAHIEVDSGVSDSGSIYKVNLSYKPTPDQHYYALVSQGYRPGGSNRDTRPAVVAKIPATYKPDVIDNYELGWKLVLLNRKIQFNGAFYHMKWTDMQITKYNGSISPVGLTSNLAEAKINGLETSLTYVLSKDWSTSASMNYNKAEVAKEFRVGKEISPAGTVLPNAPELKFSVSSRYKFNVGDYRSYAQVVFSHVGSSYNDIFVFHGTSTVDLRRQLDAYNIVNVSTGLKGENWGADLTISNLFDKRAVTGLSGNSTAYYDTSIGVNRPRTIGVQLHRNFN
ncbi:MAG: TonB-dependent receptor [Cytophaga sp.]|nr:TonB-dependent receptor [Undibacterium sp.]